jgi:hypothetical protein
MNQLVLHYQFVVDYRGAKFAFEAIAKVFGSQLFVRIPQLNEMIMKSFQASGSMFLFLFFDSCFSKN